MRKKNQPLPIIENVTITTNAGTFNCMKLQQFRDYDNNNRSRQV